MHFFPWPSTGHWSDFRCGGRKVRPSFTEIQAIVDSQPDFVRTATSHEDKYALHNAIRTGSSPEVVEYLMKQWLDALVETDATGRTPIVIAVVSGACPAVVKMLALAGPRALRMTDEMGRLPLHVALERGPWGDASVVVWCLVRHHAGALRTPDASGSLPLHTAVRLWRKELKTIKLLVLEYPEALLERDNQGRLPLHAALAMASADVDVDVVKCLVVEHTSLLRVRRVRGEPHPLMVRDDSGDLPIHTALKSGAACCVVRYLVQQRPETVREADRDGRLPIFIELDTRCRLDVVKCLVDPWLECLGRTDANGELPLHVALFCRIPLYIPWVPPGRKWVPDEELVTYLVNAGRDALRVVGGDGALPLHVALAKSLHASTIQRMVQLHPASIQRTDGNGDLPLHIALRNQEYDDVVKLIILAWDDAIDVPDGKGVLPLQNVILQKKTELVRFMVTQRPQSRLLPDSRGRLPIHTAAAAMEPTLSMMMALVSEKATTETLQRQDVDGRTPLSLAVGGSATQQVVQYLVMLCLPSLEIYDNQGRLPVHIFAGLRQQLLPLLEALVEPRPETLLRRDSDGCNPLHLVTRRIFETPYPDNFMESVRYMIRKNPMSARQRDCRGSTPLSVAVSCFPYVGVDPTPLIRELVAGWPASLRERDRVGLFPALLAATRHKPDLNVVYFLLRAGPEIVSRR